MTKWCLLLTATTNVTVDLRSTSYGKGQQRDARERQHMYSGALKHWLEKYPTLPIALVENSGDSLAWANEVAALANASARLELHPIGQAKRCKMDEIGCPEADAVLRSLRASSLFIIRRCTYVLKVTGRYAITSDIDAALRGCKHGWDIAVQNSTWGDARNNMVGTQVLGFRAALSEQLFGWSQAGSQACQECHVNAWVAAHPEARVCRLPQLSVRPVREGSTGVMRNSVR